MVMFTDELRVTRSLAKVLRNRSYEVRFDTAFDAVMIACSAPRLGQNGTWITGEVRSAYHELHRLGYAHSIETWIDGELAGGLYGVALGRMFYGESMFMRVRDASKIAFVHLVEFLVRRNFALIDCQMHTDHLSSLGAREISRADFLHHIKPLVDHPAPIGHWDYCHANIRPASDVATQ